MDTSVWSLFFRKSGPAEHPAVDCLAALVEENRDLLTTDRDFDHIANLSDLELLSYA